MATAGSLVVDLRAKTAHFARGMKKGRKELTGFQKAVGRINKTLGGLTAALTAVGVAAIGVKFGRLLAEQEKAEAKLEAVIRATGKAAGFTAGELKQTAAELQKITAIGDDTIINMQAILLTFRNIKGDQFQRATKAALDLSAVLDQDLRSSAISIGKALNDPIKGLTTLQRVGIDFTESQRAMIRNFVDTNEVAKAQIVILKELENQTEGAAKAMADTRFGRLRKVLNDLGDTAEAIAKFFTDPVFQRQRGKDILSRIEAIRAKAKDDFDITKFFFDPADPTKFEREFAEKFDPIKLPKVPEAELKRIEEALDVVSVGGALLTDEQLRKMEIAVGLRKELQVIAADEAAEKARLVKENLAKATQTLIERLEREAATFGMTALQAQLYTLQIAGAEQAQIQAVRILGQKLERLSAEAKAQDEVAKSAENYRKKQDAARQSVKAFAEGLKESTKSPGRRFLEDLGKLKAAQIQGFITGDEFGTLAAHLRGRLAGGGIAAATGRALGAGPGVFGQFDPRLIDPRGQLAGQGANADLKIQQQQLSALNSIDEGVRQLQTDGAVPLQ